jgi:patatin-related protein
MPDTESFVQNTRFEEENKLGDPTREMRIALVCFGGVSMAIYMHGITKELLNLLRASREYQKNQRENPYSGPAQLTEAVYWEALKAIGERDRVCPSVLIDVISGTSAGGINGVCLAKAIAVDGDQDHIRDLWRFEGDIKKLLGGPLWLPKTVGRWVRRGFRGGVFLGDRMLENLDTGLSRMDRKDTPRSLMPVGHRLDLCVTTTDLAGFPRRVALKSPPYLREDSHRHVFRFTYYQPGASNRSEPGERAANQFSAEFNPMLALAARASSSFPGAFPPVRVKDVRALFRKRWQTAFKRQFFRDYELSVEDEEDSEFVDGGVLDNQPFGHAIEVAEHRPAGVEVHRTILFLDPFGADFGTPRELRRLPVRTGLMGGGLANALGVAVSSVALRGQEPLLDEVQRVDRINERRGMVRRILQDRRQDVMALVVATNVASLAGGQPDIHASTQQVLGAGYRTYLQLKLASVVDDYAECAALEYPRTSDHARFTRAVMRHWASHREDLQPLASGDLGPKQIAFLKTFDLAYGRRRIAFVIDAVNELYKVGPGDSRFVKREQLDELKRALYEIRARLDEPVLMLKDGIATGGMNGYPIVRAVLGTAELQGVLDDPLVSPENYTHNHKGKLDEILDYLRGFLDSPEGPLAGLRELLQAVIIDRTSKWDSEAARREVLLRYWGFEAWDGLLFPFARISEAGELTNVELVRFSPSDATAIDPSGLERLYGDELKHFGAFFGRGKREADYLWGRLDGVELILRFLFQERTGEPDPAAVPPNTDRYLVDAYKRILAAEHDLETKEADAVRAKAKKAIHAMEAGLDPGG